MVRLALPDVPNYDTASHLVWARELLAGHAPNIGAPAAPTLHPLWLAVAAIADLTGLGAALMQLVAVAALAATAVFAGELARQLAGRPAAIITAVLVASSSTLLLLAIKAYGDLPFLALVLGALAYEARSRTRPTTRGSAAAPILLFLAGLERPEAWGIGLLLIALRAGSGAPARALVPAALLVLAAPLAWAATDSWLTGNPLSSFTGTRELAAALHRPTGVAQAPYLLAAYIADLIRPPVALLGAAGLIIALRRRANVTLLLGVLAVSSSAFLVTGAAGLPLLARYTQLPALILCVFAGTGAAWGIEVLHQRQARANLRVAIALLLAAILTASAADDLLRTGAATRLVADIGNEARWQRAGTELVRSSDLRRLISCGPVTLPTYRFTPELTLSGRLHNGTLVPRGVPGRATRPAGATVIVVEGSAAARRRIARAPGTSTAVNIVPKGYARVARRGPLTAYSRCSTSPRPVGPQPSAARTQNAAAS